MRVSELNTRVKILKYENEQNSTTGVLTFFLVGSWDKWAKVEQTNENRILEFAGISYRAAYKITVRYEKSRPTLSNYNLMFEGVEMKIYSVVKKEIGFIWYEEMNVYN